MPHEVEEAEISAIEHHLALERVEWVVGNMRQRRRQTANAKLLGITHDAKFSFKKVLGKSIENNRQREGGPGLTQNLQRFIDCP